MTADGSEMGDISDLPERPQNPRLEAEAAAELDRRAKELVRDRNEKQRLTIEQKTFKIRKPPENRQDAVRYYRDQLHWDVLPLAAPTKGGKRPIFTAYRQWKGEQLTDQMVQKYFGPGGTSNVGLIVRSPHVIIDLDSKEDHGASAQEWLTTQSHLASSPRERTGGGYHLHFICRDLPSFKKRDGGDYHKALGSSITAQVTAELFFEGLNVVLSPSVHETGALYVWEITGVFPEVSWAQLQEWFGFREPQTSRRQTGPKHWIRQYRGDLSTLNIVGLAKQLEIYGGLISADEGKHTVSCPWKHQHGDKGDGWSKCDSSSVIYEAKSAQTLPAFSCAHQQHGPKSIEQLLGWAESQQPGIVDSHCSRSRCFEKGQCAQDGRPRILLPDSGRPVGAFAAEIAAAVAPHQKWFAKDQSVVEPHTITKTEKLTYFALMSVGAVEVCTAVEQFVETGEINIDGDDELFLPTTMTEQIGRQLLAAPQFRLGLPSIHRVLEHQLPVMQDGRLTCVKVGYDERFATYTRLDAPSLSDITLDDAKGLIAAALEGFPWRSPQDLTHAIARLITPFCRGLMGWSARTPLWFFSANRPRAGKDYLNGVVQIIYYGYPFEDAALNRDREEVRKRITTALISGRRSMHFANCRDKIDQTALEQAVTAPIWVDRILGRLGEVQLVNEMEFSLSANVGVSYTADFDARVRKIRLAYPDEDANSRVFRNADLHGWVREHRSELLSSVNALTHHWFQLGQPSGPTPFSSFPEWSRVVGGIMRAAGFGDPCLPHESDGSTGDELTDAMRVLFTLCYETHPEKWIDKKDIYAVIEDNQSESDALNIFGDFSEQSRRSDQTRFGMNVRHFAGRILNDIMLEPRPSGQSGRTDRAQFRFTKPRRQITDLGAEIHSRLFGTTQEQQTAMPADVGDFGDVAKPVGNAGEEIANSRSIEINANCPEAVDCRRSRRSHPLPAAAPIAPLIIKSHQSFTDIAGAIAEAESIAFDIETYGETFDPWRGEIRILTLAVPNSVWLIDLRATGYDLGKIKSVLEAKELIAHNAKFDALWLRVKCGLKLTRLYCTCTASRLLNAGTDEKNDLAACLSAHLDVHLTKDQGCSDWGSMVLAEEQTAYCADDVRYLHDLQKILHERLRDAHLEKVAELEMALLPVIIDIEATGFAVDRRRLTALRDKARQETACADTELRNILGQSVNPDSPKQLLAALRARGNRLKNTDEHSLANCKDPAAPIILRYRASRTRRQDTQKLLDAIESDVRIHGQFNPLGADTGRFSCTQPNLQATERGEMRECFTAGEGKSLIVADYSQIELRVAAAIAPELAMIAAYKAGADLHVQTARIILKKSSEEAVSSEERRLAKAINFGLLYGQSAKGLVDYLESDFQISISEAEAKRFVARFFGTYSGLNAWQEKCRRLANNWATREIRSALGRRCLLPSGKNEFWARYTCALNMPIQGGCADGLKRAMLRLSKVLPTHSQIISTVHDELIVEAPVEEADAVKAIVAREMVDAMAQLYPRVPIEVEAKVCRTWGEK